MRGGGAARQLADLQQTVETNGAHSLPGCSVPFDRFLPVLRRAQSRGYVRDCDAEYVVDGLVNGFTLGLDIAAMRRRGKRVFRNYPTAYNAKDSVTEAVQRRLDQQKTLDLGPATDALGELFEHFDALAVFPMGAVLKPNQPDDTPPEELVWRPTDDHSRTWFNFFTVLGILGHSLNTYKEVEWLLKSGYFLSVSDVEDAFLLLPLHPALWPFMLFRWACKPGSALEHLLLHIFADFGAAGTPGTFQLFLVRIVIQMARSELILTLPMVVYVDDTGIIGEDPEKCDGEMEWFQDWSWEVCGVPWKRAKDKHAAIPQYYIGFWWDSLSRTRTLDEAKLCKYLAVLAAAGAAGSLMLRDRRSLAGKVQRAIMTMPPGAACLLVNCYNMMSGLVYPWQRRRTTKAERDDYIFVHDVLKFNVGKGYYTHDGFPESGGVLSDSSKSKQYTGGGYVEATGFYDFWKYGTAAARKPIDFLEGDTFMEWCRERGAKYRGYMVPFGLDNMSFQRSEVKGRSKAARLNTLLKELFVLQIRDGFIAGTYWLSTHDNYLADHLSRDREQDFLDALPASGFLTVSLDAVHRAEGCGRVKTLPDNPDPGMAALRQLLQEYSSNVSLDGPNRGAGVGGDAQLLSISYEFTTIYEGLPPECESMLDEVMDNRLAVSSRGKMLSGYNRWKIFCDEQGWVPLLVTGDKRRGGRFVAWVLQMKEDTELVYSSISSYVWGVRTWHVLQHQADPIYGVMHWREFMSGIAVLTAVPGEPRKMFPLETLESILDALDPKDFKDATLGLLLLVLLFTFSRTECPCPKSWNGADKFDPTRHWQVRDFRLVWCMGHWVLWVRFKSIKQDTRMERPSVRGAPNLPFEDSDVGVGHDWVPIGDIPDDPRFSIAKWYKAYVQAVGRARDREEPMFMSKDRRREYTYPCLTADLHEAQVRVGVDPTNKPHGMRVLGYNLSKATNGEALTVAHGGWMSSAHDRYERFSQAQQFSIPANMLHQESVFCANATRDISKGRASRHAFDLPASDEESDAGEGATNPDDRGASVEASVEASLLPPGYAAREHATPSGRKYQTYVNEAGKQLRSRLEAWRDYESRHGTSDPEPDYVPFTAEPRTPADAAPAVLFDVATPVVSGPSNEVHNEREPLSALARRIAAEQRRAAAPVEALPFGATCSLVEFGADQCGNPNCVVKSKNGLHPGDCRFPDPPPRRR